MDNEVDIEYSEYIMDILNDAYIMGNLIIAVDSLPFNIQ